MKNNNSDRLDADQLWQVAWTYIKTVVDTVREPFLILDKNLSIISANQTFYNFFQVTRKETEGKKIYQLGDGQWNIPKLKILLEDILPKNSHFEDFKVTYDFPRIGFKIMMLNARRVYAPDQTRPIMLVAMEDITKQIELEDKMKKYTKELTAEVAKRTAELEKRVKELERTNQLMVNRELKMIELKKEIEILKKLVKNSDSKKVINGHNKK